MKRENEHRLNLGNLLIGVAVNTGPRILFCGLREKPEYNFFGIIPGFGLRTEDGEWKLRGGHRLWAAPENLPRTYSLDDKPVNVTALSGGGVNICGRPEEKNGIRKEIEITPVPGNPNAVHVRHRIHNISRWPVNLSCWALSVMRTGGIAAVPLPEGKGVLPDRKIVFWPYTDIRDCRMVLGNELLCVRQDPAEKKPFKAGTVSGQPWIAYEVDGLVFRKEFKKAEGVYPDMGCNVEIFTNEAFLEMETLGPLMEVEPNGMAEHVEIWKIIESPKCCG